MYQSCGMCGLWSSFHSAWDKCFSVYSFSPAGTVALEWVFRCRRLSSQWVHFQFAYSKVVIILWPTNWDFLLIHHHFSSSPLEVFKKGLIIFIKTHICVSWAHGMGVCVSSNSSSIHFIISTETIWCAVHFDANFMLIFGLHQQYKNPDRLVKTHKIISIITSITVVLKKGNFYFQYLIRL